MPNPENLIGKGFESRPNDINKEGRAKGSQNRATIAKKVLGMMINTPKDVAKAFKEDYPDLPKRISIEEAMTLAVALKAFKKGDYLRYKSIMDSAYGAPKQEVEHSGDVEIGFDIGKISNSDLETILNITQKAKGADTD